MRRGKKKIKKNHPIPQNSRSTSITEIKAQKLFHGPLPPPQDLDHYNKIVPGAAETIISMWQTQVRHRQELEAKVISSDIKQSYFGASLGFVIALFAIGSGTFLAYIGRPTQGIAAIISALVGLVTVYGFGSYQRRKERNIRINQ